MFCSIVHLDQNEKPKLARAIHTEVSLKPWDEIYAQMDVLQELIKM